MLSIQIEKIINRNPYCKEWRLCTALGLMKIGMNETGIILAIEGNMDSKRFCYNYCIENKLPFYEVWGLIKGNKK